MRRLLAVSAAVLAVAAAGAAAAPGPEIDVSNLKGSQAEVEIAADPTNPNILFAASNSIDLQSLSSLGDLMRTYSSSDGGATWVVGAGPTPTPYKGRKRCNGGDPAPAIDAAGHQYLAFLATPCLTLESVLQDDNEFDLARLEVAFRPDASSAWRVSQVFPVRSKRFDDKPGIAIDRSASSPHLGRVYVTWTRITPPPKGSGVPQAVAVISHSDDQGATWSKPVAVSDPAPAIWNTFVNPAVDASGNVYVSWLTTTRQVKVDRSTDGGQTFGTDVLVGVAAGVPGDLDSQCQQPGSFGIPAQGNRCITAAPSIQVDSRPGVTERVYVVFSHPDSAGRAQDVVVRAFDAALTPVGAEVRVHAADLKRDEFLPASAVDDAGRLWICFYDTGSDQSRRTARYSCTASADGGVTWATPIAVASVASNETKKPAIPFQYGDYEGLAVAGGVAHPIWTDGRNVASRGEEIYTRTLTPADLQLP
jgi:hypothetical protein